jgi:hypothetical protein
MTIAGLPDPAAVPVSVKYVLHEPGLYAGARATVATVIQHPCDAVNTGLYPRISPRR